MPALVIFRSRLVPRRYSPSPVAERPGSSTVSEVWVPPNAGMSPVTFSGSVASRPILDRASVIAVGSSIAAASETPLVDLEVEVAVRGGVRAEDAGEVLAGRLVEVARGALDLRRADHHGEVGQRRVGGDGADEVAEAELAGRPGGDDQAVGTAADQHGGADRGPAEHHVGGAGRGHGETSSAWSSRRRPRAGPGRTAVTSTSSGTLGDVRADQLGEVDGADRARRARRPGSPRRRPRSSPA